MTSIIPCSISNVAFIPGSTFISRRNNCLTRCSFVAKSRKQNLATQKFLFPPSALVRFSPKSRNCHAVQHKSKGSILAATGTEVAVEEPNSTISSNDSDEISDVQSNAVETNEAPSSTSSASVKPASQSKRPRQARKSETPLVKDEELIPGATFVGKVRSIQPFGAFVDFGAFTDGLVHVSRLSDSFVKDVGSIVSVGQEVKVRLVEANNETGRISLTMRDSDDITKLQQQKDAPASNDNPRPARKNALKSNQKRAEPQKSSKFVKGQDLKGTVKNLTRAGAFISLPEGEEGFLPTSEEANEGFGNVMGESSLQAGQEVDVRVLRVTRGQVTLTMKKEEDVEELKSKLNQGVVHAATNPFLLAFRKNKDIAAFLDEREKVQELVETSRGREGIANETQTVSGIPKGESTSINDSHVTVSSNVEKVLKDDETSLEEINKELEAASGTFDGPSTELVSDDKKSKEKISDSSQSPDVGDATPEVEPKIGKGTTVTISSAVDEVLKDCKTSSEVVKKEVEAATSIVDNTSTDEDSKKTVSSLSEGVDTGVENIQEEGRHEIGTPEEGMSFERQMMVEAPVTNGIKDDGKSDPDVETGGDQILSSGSAVDEKVGEGQADNATVKYELQTEAASPVDKTSSGDADKEVEAAAVTADDPSTELMTDVENSESKSLQVVDIEDGTMNKEVSPETKMPVESVSSEKQTVEDPVTGGVKEDGKSDSDGKMDTNQIVSSEEEPSTENNEINSATPDENEKVEPVPRNNASSATSNGEVIIPSSQETTNKATISPALVKQLREETGAGMMDCKKALAATGEDIAKAQEFLRKKGLASADKKANRTTAEGRIGSYIHDGRIGVLIEVNCETDFVSRGDIIKELVDDLAMQVAACPQVRYLVTDDVPEEIVNKEREIEMQKEDLQSKPEQIRSKIVDGRIRKRLEELALLEQPYIKNDKVVVKDWVKQTIATIGENMKVKRFVRYNLGEGLEKKSQDFAAEVAAQTAAKQPAASGKEKAAAIEATETIAK